VNLADRLIRVPYIWKALQKTGLLRFRQQRDYRRLLRAKKEIDARLARKAAAGEPVRVLFICHRPSLWPNLRSVYEALKADPLFHVQILAVPQRSRVRGLGYFNSRFDSEGAEAFWAGEECLRGYNAETGQWLDLRSLKPDYVFYQQPYNIARPDCLLSSEVSRYAKILYLTYYVLFEIDARTEQDTPVDFMRDLSFFFAQNEEERRFVEGRLALGGPNVCQIRVTGHPRLERMGQEVPRECGLWHRPGSFRILWTPRWTTREGNCHFFTYREPLLRWCRAHENVELMFRPHPQAFREWRSTGELTEEQEEELRREFSRENFHLDESPDFYPQMYSSDVLIADNSSMIIDYFYTGKPILYCLGDGTNDGFVEALTPGLYRLSSWEEVEASLNALLEGEDPLREIRNECARKYRASDGNDSTRKICDIIREDALKRGTE
jgi:hypothetical protein